MEDLEPPDDLEECLERKDWGWEGAGRKASWEKLEGGKMLSSSRNGKASVGLEVGNGLEAGNVLDERSVSKERESKIKTSSTGQVSACVDTVELGKGGELWLGEDMMGMNGEELSSPFELRTLCEVEDCHVEPSIQPCNKSSPPSKRFPNVYSLIFFFFLKFFF